MRSLSSGDPNQSDDHLALTKDEETLELTIAAGKKNGITSFA